MSDESFVAEEKSGCVDMPALDMAKAVERQDTDQYNIGVVRQHSKRATRAYAELDPVGATLWRIDHIKDEHLNAEMKKTLKDIVLYLEGTLDRVKEALDLYESEGNRFILRRLADHSDEAETVKRQRRNTEQYVQADANDTIDDEVNALHPDWTPRTLYNKMEQREATAREVFLKYDKDRSGAIDYAELEALLQDLGFPQQFAQEAFEVIDTSNDENIQFDEFVCFYNLMQQRMRGEKSPLFEVDRKLSMSEIRSKVRRATVQPSFVKDSQELQNGSGFEYSGLVRAAHEFYGDRPPAFTDELIEEIIDYVQMLYDGQVINDAMYKKAFTMVDERDKYTMFALYKYYMDDDTSSIMLRTYLQYKIDSETKLEKRAQYHLEREKSFLVFKEEQKSSLKDTRARIHKEAEEQARLNRELASNIDLYVDDEEEEEEEEEEIKPKVKKGKKQPRWLLLYQDKAWQRKVDRKESLNKQPTSDTTDNIRFGHSHPTKEAANRKSNAKVVGSASNA